MRGALLVIFAACSHDGTRAIDAAIAVDAAVIDAAPDASLACRSTSAGALGDCMAAAACTAMPAHTAAAGTCAVAASTCCIATPNVADNPPIPAGYKYMTDAMVTADMTTWAVAILHDPVTYPMFATAMKTFGAQPVLARVEWHPPDANNGVVHRGVSLFVPAA